MDEAFRAEVGAHLGRSRDSVLREWWKVAKDDVVLRVRHGGSREAAEAAFVPTEEFQARWTAETRKQMVEFEWRKRRMAARIGDEEKRVTKGEQEAAAAGRTKQQQHREWDKDERREERVGGWRAFKSVQQTKKRKGELAGMQAPAARPEEPKAPPSFGGPKEHRVERPDEVKKAW